MGFFPEADAILNRTKNADDADKPNRERTKAGKSSKRDYSGMARGCDSCSLRNNWNFITSPKMGLSGNTKDPDILILGEAPGEDEDREGMAFVGDSGRMLHKVIPGRETHRVAFQNTVRCRPSNNATPSDRDAHACSIFLEEDLNRFDFKAIIGVGSIPLSRFFPGQAVTRIHGIKFPVRIGDKVLWYYPVLHPSFVIRSGGDRSSAAFPVLRSDIKRFFSEVDRWGTPRIYEPPSARGEVIEPRSEEEAEALVAGMKGDPAIDLESSCLRPYLRGSRLLTAAISDGTTTIAFPIDHPEASPLWGLRFLLRVASTRRWIAHNAIMELTWLLHKAEQAGIPFVPAPFDDSMAYARIYHQRETLLGLEALSRVHLGINVKGGHTVNLKAMADEPLDKILPYNGDDAWASAMIVRMLKGKAHEESYQRLLGGIRSTAQMELMGLPLDEDCALSLEKSWGGKAERIRAESSQLYEVRQFEDQKQIEFNIASNDHVGQALVEFGRIDLPKLGKGFSTDDKALNEFAEGNPLARNTLDFREATRMNSTYVQPVLFAIRNHDDGRLHPSYSTMLTATLRLSSDGPNIQNFPKRRHRELRRQIVAPPGHIIVSFDYGQLEARMFAMASSCRGLCPAVIKQIDIHSKWRDRALQKYPRYIDRLAEKTNETEEAKILKGGRDIIKTDFVFASFFGSTAGSCANRTGMPLAITQELLAEFWREYPGVEKWVKAQRTLYNDTGSAMLLTGVERHGILWGNEPLNTPIQGSAAQIVIASQNDLCELAIKEKDPYLFPRINIHDDLTFILPDNTERVYEYMEIIAERLTAIRFDFQIVPLMVEAKIGYNWADLEEVTTFTGPYIR